MKILLLTFDICPHGFTKDKLAEKVAKRGLVTLVKAMKKTGLEIYPKRKHSS